MECELIDEESQSYWIFWLFFKRKFNVYLMIIDDFIFLFSSLTGLNWPLAVKITLTSYGAVFQAVTFFYTRVMISNGSTTSPGTPLSRIFLLLSTQ
jgi:hypothetical protein